MAKFVNEIAMPMDGSPISVREKYKPMGVTLLYFPASIDGLLVDTVKRFDVASATDEGKDIKSLAGIQKNVFGISGLWLDDETPAAGSYRVLCLVRTADGKDYEEFNLLLKVLP